MKKQTMMMTVAAAVAVWGGIAVGKPVACAPEAWDVNPTAFTFRDGTMSTRGPAALGTATGTACSRKVRVRARVTPTDGGTNGWATLGVSVAQDSRNFWHLAFVQQPPENQFRHSMELCEMRNGQWLAQSADKLKNVFHRVGPGAAWERGRAYTLTLEMDETGITGTAADDTGKEVFASRYEFSDGKPAVTRGRAALHVNGGFRGTFAAWDAEAGAPDDTADARAAVVPYESDSFVPDVKEAATGFFRVQERADGRWWVIDPLGRGTVLTGVDHVRYQGHWSERTKRSVHWEVNKKKFPDKRDWEKDTIARLKAWGFNLLGAGCDPALMRRGLVHTVFLSMGDSLTRDTASDEFWICPNEHRPCSAFPNVFHPLFPAYCDWLARHKCAPQREDPWLFGYFIDNELAWWGRGAGDTGLFDAVMAKAETHTAKQALRAFLKEKGVTGEVPRAVKLEFLRLAAEKYFGIAAAAIRRYDPNHLVMGARFAGLSGAHDVVWETAGKHCDLVTFNIYPWADLDRNVVLTGKGKNAQRVADAFAARYAIVKKPMLITEWSFPALDSGLPCTSGAGQRFRTQAERTAATELFAKTMLAAPSLIGYDYFMWVDEPAEGISDAFPEDSNYGLINLQGEAYPAITRMFTALHRNLGTWRRAGQPAERPAPAAAGLTAREAVAKLRARAVTAGAGGVTFTRDGARYTVKNRAGLEMSGKTPLTRVFERVTLGGEALGSFNVMVNPVSGGSLRWYDMGFVTDVAFREEAGAGVVTVTSQFVSGETGCAMTTEVTVFPDQPWFVAEVTRVANIGTAPLDVKSFYVRQYSPFAVDKAQARPAEKRVPNLWKDQASDAWIRARDGLWWGACTASPAAEMFHYFLTNNGKGQHPDANFSTVGAPPAGSPDGLYRLAPGAVYEPAGTVWALCAGGRGGAAAFEELKKTLE